MEIIMNTLKQHIQQGYVPPFSVSAEAINLIAKISAQVERYAIRLEQDDSQRLRKVGRIKTIHSSLAIEGNTLTEGNVRDIIDGKPVVAPLRQIQEVKNAIKAYELYPVLDAFKEKDLLKAHGVMMQALVENAGHYRQGNVGVFGQEGLVHLAPPATRVPMLMADLFRWLKTSKDHLLIRSCVFHYEFEFIHPFMDGNGRMGRMWQTLLLMQWNAIFAWLPVETIVKERQQDYYDAIAMSDKLGESTTFVVFMLRCLRDALAELKESNRKKNLKSDQKILLAMQHTPSVSIRELQDLVGLSESGIKKVIRQLRERGIVKRIGGAKGGHWEVTIPNNKP